MLLVSRISTTLFVLFLCFGPPLSAQEVQEITETTVVTIPVAADKGPEDALNRGTPRGSAIGFLESAAKFGSHTTRKICSCLETRKSLTQG